MESRFGGRRAPWFLKARARRPGSARRSRRSRPGRGCRRGAVDRAVGDDPRRPSCSRCSRCEQPPRLLLATRSRRCPHPHPTVHHRAGAAKPASGPQALDVHSDRPPSSIHARSGLARPSATGWRGCGIARARMVARRDSPRGRKVRPESDPGSTPRRGPRQRPDRPQRRASTSRGCRSSPSARRPRRCRRS